MKQGLFGFLPMTGTKPRCTCETGGERHFAFTDYEVRTSPSQGKTNASRQILPAATSFPWPKWNYLHIYLFPINVQLSACVHLEIGGQVCPSTWALPGISPTLMLCFSSISAFSHADCPANAMKGRLMCSSFCLAIVWNFALSLLILHHPGPTQQLTLYFASHRPTWKQLLVFNGSTCVS